MLKARNQYREAATVYFRVGAEVMAIISVSYIMKIFFIASDEFFLRSLYILL